MDMNNEVIIYETWYDFFEVRRPADKGTAPHRVIRERTIVTEPGSLNKNPEGITYTPRTTVLVKPYFRAELLYPRDGHGPQLVLGVKGGARDIEKRGRTIKLVSMGEGEDKNKGESKDKDEDKDNKYIVRYIENLYFLNKEKHTRGALPLLYVRRSFGETGIPNAILFSVNIPLSAYHITPPPFGQAVKRGCAEKIPEEWWHALVFKSKEEEDPFVVDCEESARVQGAFMKYIVLERYWRFSLIVHQPIEKRAYGIYLPLPLMGFELG